MSDEDHDKNLRMVLAALLLAARLTNKPIGPSDEDIVRGAVRFADLLFAELGK